MEIYYRRTPPSLLERAFAGLVKRQPAFTGPVVRADVVRGIDLELRQA